MPTLRRFYNSNWDFRSKAAQCSIVVISLLLRMVCPMSVYNDGMSMASGGSFSTALCTVYVANI